MAEYIIDKIAYNGDVYKLQDNQSGFVTTDEKLKTEAIISDTTYYPIVGSNSSTASTKFIDSTGFKYKGIVGTSSTSGCAALYLGNNTASGTAGNKYGQLTLYDESEYAVTIWTDALTANRNISLPDKTGTIALTSDIPTVGFSNIGSNSATITLNGIGYTFLRSYTETDPVFSASAAAGITSTDISNWNSKTSNTGTVTQVTAGTGLKIDSATSGGNITTSGTINHINSVTAQTTQAVYPIKIDAQGHISAYGDAVTIADTKVTQTNTTDSASYRLLFSANANNDNETTTVRKSGNLLYNPSTKLLTNGVATLQSSTSTTANANAYDTLTLGNNINVSSTTAHSQGRLVIYGSTAYAHTISGAPTAARTLTLPDKSGTIALTSDIPTDSDEKLKIAAVTSGTTYYPIVATNSTAAANRQYDSTGIAYIGINGTAGDINSGGNAMLILGNSTTYMSSNWKRGTIRLYGTSAYYADLISESPTANRTITFPDKTGTIALTSDIPSYTDTNTTYTLTNALSSHKFTWTFTAGGSGSGSTTTTAELVAGTNITLTDDTTNKKITIASDAAQVQIIRW